MTTFPDDMLALNLLTVGRQLVPLMKFGLEWPPPERLAVLGAAGIREPQPGDPSDCIMCRVSMSAISDEDRATMTHVFRGAEYRYEATLNVESTARP